MSRIIKGNSLAITIKGSEKLFEIVAVDGSNVRLEDSVSGAIVTESASVISQRLSVGEAEIISKSQLARSIDSKNGLDFAAYTEEQKYIARYRLMFVSAVIDAGVVDFSKNSLAPIIDKTAEINKVKPPSIRSLQRWLKAYIDADYSIRGLLPNNHNQGNRKAKIDTEVEYFINKGI